MHVFGRPGGDLLSQVLRHSTIGAEAFDGRVRDGIGSGHFARATRPAKDIEFEARDGFLSVVPLSCNPLDCTVAVTTTPSGLRGQHNSDELAGHENPSGFRGGH